MDEYDGIGACYECPSQDEKLYVFEAVMYMFHVIGIFEYHVDAKFTTVF